MDTLLGKHHDITSFASDDPTRYAINSVHYHAEHKLLEATNGRVCIRVPVAESEEFPPVTVIAPARDCVIPLGPFGKALKNIPNGGSLPILKYMRLGVNDDGKINLTTNDLDTEQNIVSRPVEAQYPNIDQVMPKEGTFKITISAHLLKTVADYVAKHGTGENAAINFEFTDSNSSVKFTAKVADTTATGVLMPMRVT